MDALELLRRLFRHNAWADALIADALATQPHERDAWREYTHLVATEAVWLDRLLQQPARVAVWPTLTIDELQTLRAAVSSEYEALLGSLAEEALDVPVAYINSAGLSFRSRTGDILIHVALHGQYHRGKVNLLLRQSGGAPAPADYIAFVRGIPAATRSDSDRVQAPRAR